MKILLSLLTSLMLMIFFNQNTFSQQTDNWQWLNPKPQGNTIYALDFVNNSTGYAGGDFGTIMKTTDNGDTWTKLNTGFSDRLLSIDFIDGNTGFAGGDDQLLKKTTDGGQTWTDVSLPSAPDFYIFDIDFVNSQTGYVLGFFVMESLIWKTTDGGLSWTTQTTDGANYLNNLYFLDENNGFASGGTLGGQIIKTTNGGLNWDYNYQDNYAKHSMVFLNSLTGYSGSDQGRIYKTIDGGNTWNFVLSDGGIDIMSMNFTDANTGFGFGTGSVYVKTTDGGDNWYQSNQIGSSMNSQYFDASITPNGSIHAAGTFGAMVRSTNSGADFTYKVSVTDGYVSDIEFLNINTGYAVTGYNHGDILKTTDAGASWVSQITTYTTPIYGISFTSNETGYLAGSISLYKTTNGGTNWNTVYNSTTNEIFTDIVFTNANTGYAVGSYGRQMKTTNAGLNWTASTISSSGSILSSLCFVNETTGYAVGDNNAAVRTTNSGLNWNSMSVASPFINLTDVFFTDINNGYISCTTGIYRTTNGGDSWFALSTPAGGYAKVQFRGNFGYSITGNGKIIKTIDGGVNWIVQPTITTNGLSALYFNSDNFIYAGGLLGTMLKTIPTELIITHAGNINTEIPGNFLLSQNYPNPFNPSTKITFEIPNSGLVTLKVFDITGKLVDVLLNGNKNSGKYTVDFNGSSLASGVYFYSLTSNDFTDTKKMILMK